MMQFIHILFLLLTIKDCIAHQSWFNPPSHGKIATCNIPILNLDHDDDLNPNNILHRLSQHNKPVLIRGALANIWKDTIRKWSNKTKFLTNNALVPIANEVLINKTLDVGQDGPNSLATFKGHTLGKTIENFDSVHEYQLLQHKRNNRTLQSMLQEATVKPLLFQRTTLDQSLLQAFDTASEIKKIPPILRRLNSAYRVVSIGGPGVGLPPHSHSASWLGVIVGEKKWWFFPSESLTTVNLNKVLNSSRNNNNDEIDLYTKVSLNSPLFYSNSLRNDLLRTETMYACTQKQGDVIYVPGGWLHATSNIGDVIAVGGQSDGQSDVPDDNAIHVPTNKQAEYVPINKQAEYESEPLNIFCIQQWATEQVLLGVERSEKIAKNKMKKKSKKKQKKVRKRRKKSPMEVDFIKVIRFIQSRVKAAVEQAALGHLHPVAATQIVGRLGAYLETLPDFITDLTKVSPEVFQDFTFPRRVFINAIDTTQSLYKMSERKWMKKAKLAKKKRRNTRRKQKKQVVKNEL